MNTSLCAVFGVAISAAVVGQLSLRITGMPWAGLSFRSFVVVASDWYLHPDAVHDVAISAEWPVDKDRIMAWRDAVLYYSQRCTPTTLRADRTRCSTRAH